ncbi:MAG: XRE family transcriptional regulator, partial [Actinomycetes bacterium]
HDGRTTPGVQGMAAQMAARGHALMGEAEAARVLLDEAERLIVRATERPEDEPAWMYFYDDGWFAMQRGMAEIELGAGDRAVPLLEAGLARLPEAYRRDRAWFGSCLAKAHLLTGDADAAAGTALRFAEDALAVNAYAVRTLREVAAELRDTGIAAARDLGDLLAGARNASGREG